jgi:hypothetical protein
MREEYRSTLLPVLEREIAALFAPLGLLELALGAAPR